jgi:hypothetical protein
MRAHARHILRADGAGDGGIHDAFGDLAAIGQQHRRLVIRWPTLRMNSRLRPGRVSVEPSSAVHRGQPPECG